MPPVVVRGQIQAADDVLVALGEPDGGRLGHAVVHGHTVREGRGIERPLGDRVYIRLQPPYLVYAYLREPQVVLVVERSAVNIRAVGRYPPLLEDARSGVYHPHLVKRRIGMVPLREPDDVPQGIP